MSAELFKFLRKAVLRGDKGAEALMGNVSRSARHDILSSLAQVRPHGELDHGFMLSEELPWLGDKAKAMVRSSRAELSKRQALPPEARDLASQSNEMYNDWSDSMPWRKK